MGAELVLVLVGVAFVVCSLQHVGCCCLLLFVVCWCLVLCVVLHGLLFAVWCLLVGCPLNVCWLLLFVAGCQFFVAAGVCCAILFGLCCLFLLDVCGDACWLGFVVCGLLLDLQVDCWCFMH